MEHFSESLSEWPPTATRSFPGPQAWRALEAAQLPSLWSISPCFDFVHVCSLGGVRSLLKCLEGYVFWTEAGLSEQRVGSTLASRALKVGTGPAYPPWSVGGQTCCKGLGGGRMSIIGSGPGCCLPCTGPVGDKATGRGFCEHRLLHLVFESQTQIQYEGSQNFNTR